MPIRVDCFATYLTDVAAKWRRADYNAHDFVFALKGRSINKYSQLAVRGIEPGQRRRLIIGELLVVGQPVTEMPEEACDGAGTDDEGGSGKSQTDLDEIEHGHFLRGARKAFNVARWPLVTPFLWRRFRNRHPPRP